MLSYLGDVGNGAKVFPKGWTLLLMKIYESWPIEKLSLVRLAISRTQQQVQFVNHLTWSSALIVVEMQTTYFFSKVLEFSYILQLLGILLSFQKINLNMIYILCGFWLKWQYKLWKKLICLSELQERYI